MFASSFSFLPKKMEILTEEPTPIKSASEKLISTNGNAGLRAAKAASPSKFPTKIPSNNPHKEAIMLIAPGIAIIKKQFYRACLRV